MPSDRPETTDLLARLRLVAAWRKPGGPTPSEPMPFNYKTICDAIDEIERLRAVVRVNALRWAPHLTHAEIDEVINGKQS